MRFGVILFLTSCAAGVSACPKAAELRERAASANELVRYFGPKDPAQALALYGAAQAYEEIAEELEKECTP